MSTPLTPSRLLGSVSAFLAYQKGFPSERVRTESEAMRASILRKIKDDGPTFHSWSDPHSFYDPFTRSYGLTLTARVEWDAAWEKVRPKTEDQPHPRSDQ